MKTAKQAIAATFGWSTSELHEYVYHHGHTKAPIYSIGDEYFTTSKTRPTAEDCGDTEYAWVEYSDQFFAHQAGTMIWVAKAESSDKYSGKSINTNLMPTGKDPW